MNGKSAMRFGVVALLAWLSVGTTSFAQTAQELYEQGMAALNAGRYKEAAEKLDGSYRAQPVALVLYNLGLAYSGMGYPDRAVESFEAYVQYADPNKEGRTIAAVRQEVERIKNSYGRFSVTLTPAEALIEIDGYIVAPRDGKLWVQTGQHRIVIRAQGYETYEQTLQVTAGKFDLDIKLREPTGPPAVRAAALIDEGVALQASGNFPGAIEKYQQAQAIQPSPRGAGQMGLAEDSLGDLARAQEHINEALAAKRDPWVRENRRKLQQTLARIEKQIAELTFSGTPDGAEVFVNGRSVGRLPFPRSVKVASGNLTVRAEHEGYDMWEQTVVLAPHDVRPVTIEMTKKAEPPLVVPIPIPPPEPVVVAPPPEPTPPPPPPEPEKPSQADIEAMSKAQDEGEPPDEHGEQTGFEMHLNFGYQFWVGGPKPGTTDGLPGSSGALVPLQLGLGARIIWPLSFGVQINSGLDLGADGTKVVVNANPGLYVRGHAGKDKKSLGWDVWGGIGLQPIAMQVLVLEAREIDPTMIPPGADPAAVQRAIASQMTGVSNVRTVQSLNFPLELGATLFLTKGMGLDLAMALTFWFPSSSCLHDEKDSLCTDSGLDTQTSFFIGAGLTFLP
jgi:tetratricopeptide (TPR) repeat protein